MTVPELAGRCVHLFPLGLHCNEAAQPGEFGGAPSGPVATPLEMAAELAGLAEHVTADHAALARVWAVARHWRIMAGTRPPASASMYRDMATIIERAVTGDGGPTTG